MIKTNLGELMIAIDSLNKLAKLSEDGKLSFRANLKLNKIIKRMQPDLDEYNTERLKLAEKFGEPVDQEGNFKITDLVNFNKYLTQLNSIELELDNTFPFTESDLENITDLSINDIARLGPFIEEPEIEEKKERKPIRIEYD